MTVATQAIKRLKHNLDMSMPAASDVALGTFIYDILADVTALATAYEALLAKLDTADLAGVGNNNVATLSVTTTATLPPTL